MDSMNEIGQIIEDLIVTLDDSINSNVNIYFENAYELFHSILKNETDGTNIQKMIIFFISQLYDIIYLKTSFNEELLNDHINDEDGHFFEFYRDYTSSKNQEVVTHLNEIMSDMESMVFTKDNIDYIKNYIDKFIYLYNMSD
jgi:hypothetical protein